MDMWKPPIVTIKLSPNTDSVDPNAWEIWISEVKEPLPSRPNTYSAPVPPEFTLVKELKRHCPELKRNKSTGEYRTVLSTGDEAAAEVPLSYGKVPFRRVTSYLTFFAGHGYRVMSCNDFVETGARRASTSSFVWTLQHIKK